jgi:hypothetical protein
MERALQSLTVLALAVFCALMWGIHVQREALTSTSAGLQATYTNLLAPEEDERSTVWGIYFGSAKVGSTHTDIVREGRSAIRISSTTRLSPEAAQVVSTLTGRDEPLEMVFQATITPLRGLRTFHITVEGLDVILHGNRKGDSLVVSGTVGGRKVRETLPMGRQTVVGSMFSPVSSVSTITAENIGQSWNLAIVQPLTGELQQVSVAPVASTMVPVDLETGAEPEPVFKLRFQWQRRVWHAWVRADGEPLMQQLPPPLPLTLRREDINKKALAELRLGPEPGGE